MPSRNRQRRRSITAPKIPLPPIRKSPKPSDAPDIRGTQEHVLKTTENGKPKAQPLQPTPQPRPETVAKEAAQKKEYTPGDLAMAKPSDTTQHNEVKTDAQTAVAPQAQPVPDRPRTIADALARVGTIGPKGPAGGRCQSYEYHVVAECQEHLDRPIRRPVLRRRAGAMGPASGGLLVEFGGKSCPGIQAASGWPHHPDENGPGHRE